MKNKISLKNLHIIVIILGTIFIFASVFHSNIWFDEAYSVGMANQNIVDIWNIGGHDVHPVLYYWMLRFVSILTTGSILAYRLFSALPIALLGLFGITHIKKDFGEKTGILFSFFSYFLPMMAVYANQIRMYSWGIYMVTILAIYTYRIYRGQSTKKNWIIFGITSLCSIYIHYYGLMAAGLINLYLLVHFIKRKMWKELRIQIVLGIIQVILFTPWVIALISQMEHVSGGFWIGFTFPDTIYEIVGCQMNGTRNETWILFIGFLINTLLFILLGITAYKNRENEELNLKALKYSIGIYLSVIIAALIITVILGSSVLYYRYLFVITGLYIFVVSHILANSNNKYIITIVCVVVLILGTYNNIVQLNDNYSSENGKQIEYLKENIKKDDVLVYSNIGNGSVFASYFTENKQYFYNGADWGVEEAYKNWAPQMETWITTEFLEKCTGRVWIIDSQDNGFYNELFNTEDFKFISTEYFDTPYQNYIYNITLVERVR